MNRGIHCVHPSLLFCQSVFSPLYFHRVISRVPYCNLSQSCVFHDQHHCGRLEPTGASSLLYHAHRHGSNSHCTSQVRHCQLSILTWPLKGFICVLACLLACSVCVCVCVCVCALICTIHSTYSRQGGTDTHTFMFCCLFWTLFCQFNGTVFLSATVHVQYKYKNWEIK